MGDFLTGGFMNLIPGVHAVPITQFIRQEMGWEKMVDHCSGFYTAGTIAGNLILAGLTGGAGEAGVMTGEGATAADAMGASESAEMSLAEEAGAPLESAAAEAGEDSITSILQEHVENAVSRFESEGFTERQAQALESNPRLEAAFKGERIDKFFRESIASDSRLDGVVETTPRGKFGPDVFDSANNRWWDVTTERSWGSHVMKYSSQFGAGTGLFY